VSNTTEQSNLIALKPHPRTATIAKPATRQGGRQISRRHSDVSREAIDRRHQCRPMGFAGRQKTQHKP
jgi:hypothetical protein